MPRGWKSSEGMKYVRSFLKAIPLVERFWAKVRKDPGDGCWHWTGEKDYRASCPYGRIWIRDDPRPEGGRPRHVRKMAHRCSWEDIHDLGEIPEGVTLDHICKNTLCVRPDHLRLATTHENFVINSNSPFALNRKKTHCKHGHLLDGKNVIWQRRPSDGGRITRACVACRPYMANTRYRVEPPADVLQRWGGSI